MSIKARLVIAISLAVAVAFAVIGFVTVTVTEDRMIDRIDESLRAAPAGPFRVPADSDRPAQFDGRRATATLVINLDGTVKWADPAGYMDDPLPLPVVNLGDLTAHENAIFTTGADDGSSLEYRVLVRPTTDGFLVQAAPLDDVEATIVSLLTVISLSALAVLAAITLVVWLTIRRGLRPIDDMIRTAGLIADGDLSHRIEHATTATEVGRLGHALNAMLGQIETSFAAKEASEQRLRRFIADASHELRTPLTSIRGYAELFRSGVAADPPTLERVMHRIESESMRMGTLVEDLLLLARLDQGRPLAQEPVDLVRLLDDVVMDARAIEPNRPIECSLPAEASVLGDADRLRQVMVNVLTNARVHTDPDTPVRVRLETTDQTVTVQIADEGAGMTLDEAERVFDRFYRVDTSRARTSGGSGLGLSIVASIIEAHGGRVTLDSTPGRGTTVTLTLARIAAAESAPRDAPMSEPSIERDEQIRLDPHMRSENAGQTTDART